MGRLRSQLHVALLGVACQMFGQGEHVSYRQEFSTVHAHAKSMGFCHIAKAGHGTPRLSGRGLRAKWNGRRRTELRMMAVLCVHQTN